jgi:hypothetical protein
MVNLASGARLNENVIENSPMGTLGGLQADPIVAEFGASAAPNGASLRVDIACGPSYLSFDLASRSVFRTLFTIQDSALNCRWPSKPAPAGGL